MAKQEGKHVAKHAAKRRQPALMPVIIAAAVIAVIIVTCMIIKNASGNKPAENTDSAPASESTPASENETQQEAQNDENGETPEETEASPEPLYDEPEYFTISCIGDNTLWSSVYFEYSASGLPLTVGDDYAYPYSNTVQYFTDDELTLANLENNFSDSSLQRTTLESFYFLAPTAYAQILSEGGVDFVTAANNHIMDYGDKGAESTYQTIEDLGIGCGKDLTGTIITTKSGLKIGIYTAGNDIRPYDHTDEILEGIRQLKEDGAEYIICMFHWSKELVYTPSEEQRDLAYACIDAGADLIYGSHPHCLQPVEEYNGGVILYSLGNWVFGGNTAPSDPDTAIIQVVIERDIYGNLSTSSYSAIPCCVSSRTEAALNGWDNYNDYCPTPYEEGTEAYERVLSKLSGTFEATSEGKDYSGFYASWG